MSEKHSEGQMSARDDFYDEHPPPEPKYVYRGGGKYDDAIKQVSIALVIAGIVGFVGMCFAVNGAITNLRETTSVLRTVQDFQQQQIAELKSADVRIEGKVFRGHAQAMGLDDADQP